MGRFAYHSQLVAAAGQVGAKLGGQLWVDCLEIEHRPAVDCNALHEPGLRRREGNAPSATNCRQQA